MGHNHNLFPLKSVLHLKQAEVVFNKVNVILTRSAVRCLPKVTKSKQTRDKSCVEMPLRKYLYQFVRKISNILLIIHLKLIHLKTIINLHYS